MEMALSGGKGVGKQKSEMAFIHPITKHETMSFGIEFRQAEIRYIPKRNRTPGYAHQ
jgi:hypothetical protein